MKQIICSTWFALISLIVSAQNEKIETDRPGKTISPVTVLKKWMQFESGFTIQTEKVNVPKKDLYVQHPFLLTKYGLGKRIEIRLISEFATIKEKNVNGNTSRTGLNSIQLGGKLNFLKGKGFSPRVSLIAHYDFRRFRTMYKSRDTIDGANFRVAFQHTFSENIFLSYNVGIEWKTFDTRNPTYLFSFSPRLNITENWFAFIEIFGFIWKNDSPENSIDFGFAYYLSNNFKIDASAGFGLNKKAPDNFYSIGASFRLKTTKGN